MTDELKDKIISFHNKLSDLQDERREIENILSYEYDVDVYSCAEYIEDQCFWVYGFDLDALDEVIKEAKEC